MKITHYCIVGFLCLFPVSGYSQPDSPATEIDRYNQYQGQNGEFFAALLSIPEVELSEFDKPSDQGPRLSLISTAACQDRIAFKLIFKNMELAEGNLANVTFDFKMTRPDGTVSPGSEHEDLPAYQGTVLVRDNLYNSDATPIVEFETNDMTGQYVASALIKDNIGNRTIQLYKTVELLECGEI